MMPPDSKPNYEYTMTIPRNVPWISNAGDMRNLVRDMYSQVLTKVMSSPIAVTPGMDGMLTTSKKLADVNYLIGASAPIYMGILSGVLNEINRTVFPTIVTDDKKQVTNEITVTRPRPEPTPEYGTGTYLEMSQSSTSSKPKRYQLDFEMSADYYRFAEGAAMYMVYMKQISGLNAMNLAFKTMSTILMKGVTSEPLMDSNGKPVDDKQKYHRAVLMMRDQFALPQKNEKGVPMILDYEKEQIQRATYGEASADVLFYPREYRSLLEFSNLYMKSSPGQTRQTLGTDSIREGGGTEDLRILNNIRIMEIPKEPEESDQYQMYSTPFRVGEHLIIDPDTVWDPYNEDVDGPKNNGRKWGVTVNNTFIDNYTFIPFEQMFTEGAVFLKSISSSHKEDIKLISRLTYVMNALLLQYDDRKKALDMFRKPFRTMNAFLEDKAKASAHITKLFTEVNNSITKDGQKYKAERFPKDAVESDTKTDEYITKHSKTEHFFYVDYFELFHREEVDSILKQQSFKWGDIPFFRNDGYCELDIPVCTARDVGRRFRVMLSRPMGTYMMRPIVVLKSGEETGYGTVSNPIIMPGRGSVDQSIHVSSSVWMGFHVVNKSKIRVVKNALVERMIGGGNATIINRVAAERYAKTKSFEIDDETDPSVYVLLLPKSRQYEEKPYIHLRGKSVFKEPEDDYPCPTFWCSIYRWIFQGTVMGDEYRPRQVAERSWPMSYIWLSASSKAETRFIGSTHFGPYSEYPNTANVRKTGRGHFPFHGDAHAVQSVSYA